MATIILKIGGSVITQKKAICTARKEQIDRISQEIKSFKIDTSDDMILVHGAGSFGHPQALKYMKEGYNASDIYIVHKSIKMLNSLVVESLHESGINALPVHPLSFCFIDKGKLDFPYRHIKIMLEKGIIPVIHGDIVIDKEKGATILSGDRIVAHLAIITNSSKIGAGVNYEGVLNNNGEVIKKIDNINFVDIKEQIKGSSSPDVTGGMIGKVNEFLELTKHGINSRIFNACKKGNISKFLYGEDVGTLIAKL